MKLGEVFPQERNRREIAELEIEGVAFDSREVKKGDVFFIIEGKKFDVFSVLKEIEDVVTVFVVEKRKEQKVKEIIKKKPLIFVENIQKEFRRVVDMVYTFEGKRFKFIGITGTNGKTTTAYLIYQLLKKLGKKVSLIGTVNYYLGEEKIKATYTTPPYLYLRKLFRKMKEIDSEFIVMEVSSHGIAQKRIEGINFACCVFTNLGRDHLDYHKTIENYFSTKRKFFLDNPLATCLINIDDPYGKRLFQELNGKKFSFGIENNADFKAEELKILRKGVEFYLKGQGRKFFITSSLLGRHNILNMLGSVGTIFSLGFPLEKVINHLAEIKGVEGRLEEVANDIFVDYAHTPFALKSMLSTLRKMGYNKIIAVWGCGGDRDKGKRKIMARIASQLADYNFITMDNPRSEDPLEICYQIKEGLENNNFSIILDRRKAIEEALSLKKRWKNGAVAVLGKGHEDYQIIGETKVFFKDKEEIKKALL